jgi:integrase
MANTRKLSALKVERLKKTPGFYGDGGGLYLQVTSKEAQSWIFKFQRKGRQRMMGLGSLDIVPLAEARDKAIDCRRLLLNGIDPIEARAARQAAAKLEAARSITFEECVTAFVKAHLAGWGSAKHATQWKSSLSTHCFPVLGTLAVQDIDTALVMRVLEPIWSTKAVTAGRVRGRIEAVLDWATVHGYRRGENPARWRGHLDKLLPKLGRVRKVRHFPALPYAGIGAFMDELRKQESIGARALEFVILTAARTGEVIGARWEELDMHGRMWTVPASRTKTGREHRVPLSVATVAVVEQMRNVAQNDFVFPGANRDQPISDMRMFSLMRRMGRADLTVHGFRSTFRDWAAEQTAFPNEVVEMALGHIVAGKVEAAYRRGDLFEKRGLLMEAWANYCATPAKDGKIIPMRRASE